MSEAEAIERTRDGPVTIDSLVEDLKKIGLEPGSTVIAHSSLSSIGWVCGGAVSLILALEKVLRPFGNLVMPTQSGDLSDPSGWEHPPVPESWWDTIRKSMPAFDPELTPSRGVGTVPEVFRKQADVIRSAHPQDSFAAWGENCFAILEKHSLELGLGEMSPLRRIYDSDGQVLLIGVDHSVNTSLHLSEVRANYRTKKIVDCSSPVFSNGHRRWKTYKELNYDSSDFALLGNDFIKDNKNEIRIGKIGQAETQLFSQRLCVDYGVKWIEKHRR